ncbi:hypothetical protein D3C75_882260 [compost metagenome]
MARFADIGQQAVSRFILLFARFAFAVLLVTIETLLGFLAIAACVKHGINGIAIIFLHTLWETRRHDCLSVVRRINTDNVEQIRRTHRLTKKPGQSFTTIGVLPILLAQATTLAIV